MVRSLVVVENEDFWVVFRDFGENFFVFSSTLIRYFGSLGFSLSRDVVLPFV